MSNVIADYPDWSTFTPNTLTAMFAAHEFSGGVSGSTILAAPTSGAYYLYGFDIYQDADGTAGPYYLYNFDSEAAFAGGWCDVSAESHLQLNGFRIAAPVHVLFPSTERNYALRYAIGP
jgi:hypothetical protein